MASKGKMPPCVIEEGIPIPDVRLFTSPLSRIKGVYPFAEMRVGDSFVIPLYAHRRMVDQASKAFARRHGKVMKFTVRLCDNEGTVRCWRIK